MRIYTRTGDEGSSGLPGGVRRRKDHPHFWALGDLDEATAALGLAIASAEGDCPLLVAPLLEMQRQLLAAGADLAAIVGNTQLKPYLEASAVSWLEALIDEHAAILPPLSDFLLPGGCEVAARLHMARAVVRRWERSLAAAVELNRGGHLLAYSNRLSDALFILARRANQLAGVAESLWH